VAPYPHPMSRTWPFGALGSRLTQCRSTCIQFIPSIEGHMTSPQNGCKSFFEETSPTDRLRESFLRTATKFRAPVSGKLTPVVVALLERAKEDLVALRLSALDPRDDAWVMAARLPLY